MQNFSAVLISPQLGEDCIFVPKKYSPSPIPHQKKTFSMPFPFKIVADNVLPMSNLNASGLIKYFQKNNFIGFVEILCTQTSIFKSTHL
jgi:hypothetical protein